MTEKELDVLINLIKTIVRCEEIINDSRSDSMDRFRAEEDIERFKNELLKLNK